MIHPFPPLSRSLVLALVVLVSSSACQRAADSAADAAIERASGGKVEVERDGDTVVFKTEDGQMAVQGGDSLALPADYPKDVYLPADYAVNSVMDLQGMNVLGLRAPGQVPALFADARKTMLAQGWKETMAMQHSAESALLAFEKGVPEGEARVAMLSFGSDGEDGVQVSVQLRQQAQ